MNRFLGRNLFSPTRLPPSARPLSRHRDRSTRLSRFFFPSLPLQPLSFPFFFLSFSTLPSCSPIPVCTTRAVFKRRPSRVPFDESRTLRINEPSPLAVYFCARYFPCRLIVPTAFICQTNKIARARFIVCRLALISRVAEPSLNVCRKTQLDSTFDLTQATDESRVICREEGKLMCWRGASIQKWDGGPLSLTKLKVERDLNERAGIK